MHIMKQIITIRLKTIILSLLIFGLQSCIALNSPKESPIMKIHQGQPQEEVFQLLGKPSYRRFNEKQEEWEYRHWYNDSSCKVTIITFVNRLVTKMDNFYVQPEKQIIKHEAPSVVERPIYPPVGSRGVRPEYIGQHHTISDEDFNRIIKEDFRGVFFTDDYLKKIRFYSKSIAFSCRQTKRLLKFFNFSDDKLKALRIVAPYISDRMNYRIIISEFDLLTQDDALKILGYEEDQTSSVIPNVFGF